MQVSAVMRDRRTTRFGEFLALNPPLLLQGEGFAPFALQEKGRG